MFSHDTPRHRPCCLLVGPKPLLHPQHDHPSPTGVSKIGLFVPPPTADVTARDPTAQVVIAYVTLGSPTTAIVIA